jgi:hypothetical protein
VIDFAGAFFMDNMTKTFLATVLAGVAVYVITRRLDGSAISWENLVGNDTNGIESDTYA